MALSVSICCSSIDSGDPMRALAILILLFSLPLTSAGQQEASPPLGAIVNSIDFRPALSTDSLGGLLELEVGKPFSPEALRTSLKNIFRLGIYSDVRALWGPSDGGIALIIELEEIPLIEAITIRGHGPLSKQQIIKTAGLDRDLRYDAERGGHIVDVLRELYRSSGYWLADVRVFAMVNLQTDGVRLEINIDPGEPTAPRSLLLKGFPVLSQEEILSAFEETGIERLFIEQSFKEDVQRLQQVYADLGYLATEIVAGEPIFDAGENKVDLELRINAGPVININLITAGPKYDRMISLIPFQDYNVPLNNIVENGKRRILEALQAEGHIGAEVEAGLRIDPDVGNVIVDLSIIEGPAYKTGRLDLKGISEDQQKIIRPQLSLTRKGWFSRTMFSERKLQEDIQRVLQLLRDDGYLEAVLVDRKVDLNSEALRVDIDLTFDLGPRAKATRIVFSGNETFSDDELTGVVGIAEGDPLTTASIAASLQRLRDFYDAEGFAEARITVSNRIGENGRELAFDIRERERSVIKKIIIAGNDRTREGVIKRSLTFGENSPFSWQQISESQRALYRLGIFSRVLIGGVEEELAKDERRVVVRVDETMPYSLQYGFGVDKEERLRFSFGVSNNNVTGRNVEISFNTRVSSLQQRYQLSFRAPRLVRGLVDNTIRLFYEEVDKRLGYDVRRKGVLLESTGFRWRGWRITGRYQFKWNSIIDIDEDLPLQAIDRYDRNVRLSLLSAILTRDTRDDLIDPSTGSFTNLILQYSPSWLASQVSYVKGLTQAFVYKEVLPSTVVAAGARIGLSKLFSGATELPISERFFAGGSTTLRAFDLDSVGPQVTAVVDGDVRRFPVGGDAMLIGNLELRFPLLRTFKGVLFYDVGNVYAQVSGIDLDDLTHTVGIGFRYDTPLGPLRVDYGKSPDEGVDSLFFSFGHAF